MELIYNVSFSMLVILLFCTKVFCDDDTTSTQSTFLTSRLDLNNTAEHQTSILDTVTSSSPLTGDVISLFSASPFEHFNNATSSDHHVSSIILGMNLSTPMDMMSSSSSSPSSSILSYEGMTMNISSSSAMVTSSSSSSSLASSISFSGSIILDQLSSSPSLSNSKAASISSSTPPSLSSFFSSISPSPSTSDSSLSSEIPSSSSSSPQSPIILPDLTTSLLISSSSSSVLSPLIMTSTSAQGNKFPSSTDLHLTTAPIDLSPTTSTGILVTTALPTEDNLSSNQGSIGYIAGPIIGGIIGLTAIFGAAYIIGRERGRNGSPMARNLSGVSSFNENPAFSTVDAEQIPEPVEVRSFPSYVNELHEDGNRKFQSQYQMLVKLSPHHEKSVSELPQNRNKNRYANVLPYDAARVKLTPIDFDEQATDYINASYIPGQTYQREYIAAQGPLTNTLADFWRMVWEQNVSCIVMLTNLKEEGKDKCAKYWPSKSDVYQDESLSYGDIQVCLTSESVLNHHIVRVLQVQLGSVSRSIRQYHFLDWMDNSSPQDVENFLNFTRDVRAFSNRNSPTLVHCSSGAGRTGTFILIDRMLQVVDRDGKLDLFRTTLDMRGHRISMVQNETQFIFAHDAIKRAVDEKIFGALHHGFDGFDEIS